MCFLLFHLKDNYSWESSTESLSPSLVQKSRYIKVSGTLEQQRDVCWRTITKQIVTKHARKNRTLSFLHNWASLTDQKWSLFLLLRGFQWKKTSQPQHGQPGVLVCLLGWFQLSFTWEVLSRFARKNVTCCCFEFSSVWL